MAFGHEQGRPEPQVAIRNEQFPSERRETRNELLVAEPNRDVEQVR